MKKCEVYKLIIFIFLISLIIFEASYMMGIITLSSPVLPAYVRLLAFSLTILSVIIDKKIYRNSFIVLFGLWAVYYFMIQFLFGKGTTDRSGIFILCWFQCGYIITFYCGLHSDKIIRILKYFFMIIFFEGIYIILSKSTLFQNDISSSIESNIQKNLIFWVLCTVPAIFLIRKETLKTILLFIALLLCLLMSKRSALIAILLISALYFYYSNLSKNKKNNALKRLFIIVIFSLGIFYFTKSRKFPDLLEVNIERFSSVGEDKGSGRMLIWNDVLNRLSNNESLEWFVGNGMGSSQSKTLYRTTSHNDFLTLLFEFGILSVGFYLVFILLLIKRLFKLYRSNSYLFMAYASASIIIVVLSGVSDLFVSYSYIIFLMAIIGLIEAEITKQTRSGYKNDNNKCNMNTNISNGILKHNY